MGKTGQRSHDRDLDKASRPGQAAQPEASCQGDDFGQTDQRRDSAWQQPAGGSTKSDQNGESGVPLAAAVEKERQTDRHQGANHQPHVVRPQSLGPDIRWPSQSCQLPGETARSEEHTSELQSQSNLVCRLLLEKKKTNKKYTSSCAIIIATINNPHII